MKKTLVTVILGAGLALAQTPAGQQPTFDTVKAYLGLSDALIQNLEQLRTAEQQEIQPLGQSIQQKQQAIQQGLQSGASAATLGQLLLDIQAIQKQVTSVETKYLNQAVAMLSADQKTKLKTLSDAQALAPSIHEATALGLLERPQGAAGPGAGPGMRGLAPDGMMMQRRRPARSF